MTVPIYLIFILLIAWLFERFYLRGRHNHDYPTPSDPCAVRRFGRPDGPGPEHETVVQNVSDLASQILPAVLGKQLQSARNIIDGISDNHNYVCSFRPVAVSGVPAEWVIAPGTDISRRLLYIHGGGFIMGSPKSHRTMTSKFSEIADCAVLAIDYRLLPEHRHMDCVEDCRAAYQWLLEHGPERSAPPRALYLAGDSAGANLALSLLGWVRDAGLRAPDAAVALSPLTDSTFSAASIHDNEATDIMLAPMLGRLNRLPQFIKSGWVVWAHRIRPANPVVSPLFGDLSCLPPTLVQASEAEMLLDDARRYVYKARASGSPAYLQTWADMVHVWQIFDPDLPQATEAWSEISRFLKSSASA